MLACGLRKVNIINELAMLVFVLPSIGTCRKGTLTSSLTLPSVRANEVFDGVLKQLQEEET